MLKPLEQTIYHSVLRVSALIMTAVLIFDSGLFSSATARLSGQTQLYLANAVGVYVGVGQNDTNVLTTRIAELEQTVAQREAELRDRNLNIGIGGGANAGVSTFILSGILFILLVLIVLNYALDYARARERYAASESLSKVA